MCDLKAKAAEMPDQGHHSQNSSREYPLPLPRCFLGDGAGGGVSNPWGLTLKLVRRKNVEGYFRANRELTGLWFMS